MASRVNSRGQANSLTNLPGNVIQVFLEITERVLKDVRRLSNNVGTKAEKPQRICRHQHGSPGICEDCHPECRHA